MGIPELDPRTKEDILNQIAARAKAYTPEWRFDRRDPDLGAALSAIYAELFSQTLKRFNRVPEKNMTAFFDSMGARLLPAIPAEGFVRFGLSGDVQEGSPVPSGTPLLADADNDEGSTVFETVDDVLVTPAAPEQIFTVSSEADAIVCNWAGGDETFRLFDWRGKNLQKHEWCLSQQTVLSVTGGAYIDVELIPSHQSELPREVSRVLADPARVQWEYSHGSSWQPVSVQKAEGNHLTLHLEEQKLPVTPLEEDGEEKGLWLRARLLDQTGIPPMDLRLVRLASSNQNLLPDLVHANGADQDIHEFFPFGEQLGLFAEAYFGCQEALMKKGAWIDMTFNLDFVPVPLEYDPAVNPINWKLIMKKSDFKVDEEFDITVQEVIWEYFNGNGWARLFPDSRESDCFYAGMGALGQRKTIRFRVPEDMEPVLVNADTGYFVRARVLKVKNFYKMKGNYIVPLMEGLRFSYSYEGKGRLPEQVVTENGMVRSQWDSTLFKHGDCHLQPFKLLDEKGINLYIGFGQAPMGGPIKMLFQLEESLRDQPGRLRWEYRGTRGWETLNVVDETENLKQTGILTLMGDGEFQRCRLWDRDLYWIRAVDQEGRYSGTSGQPQLPRVSGLYMNAVRVRNVATQKPEQFYLEAEQKNYEAKLLHGRVYEAQVWVNEVEQLRPHQLEQLEAEQRLRVVRDASGALQEAWVRWEEQEDFALSGPEDRHYTLDRNEGVVHFSDGVNGKIPPSAAQETIEVWYKTGGGREGNVDAGAINRSSQALGLVSTIENPRPTAGGCDQETVEEAVIRGGSALCHGDRAVTIRDFERLAMEATRNIAGARCFSNLDRNGKKASGQVTLVVLLRDYLAGGELQIHTCNQVEHYIRSRCSGNLVALQHFHVIPPQLLEMRVKVELSVHDMNQVFSTRQAVQARLEEFLDPITGNFDGRGWRVGQVPNDTQLRNCLSSVTNGAFLSNVSAAAFLETGFGPAEVVPEMLKTMPFVLPRSGEHTILITVT